MCEKFVKRLQFTRIESFIDNATKHTKIGLNCYNISKHNTRKTSMKFYERFNRRVYLSENDMRLNLSSINTRV
jgi:hypothetical protein